MKKTVIFEEKYGVNISDFSTTEEIDKVVEKEIGRELEIVTIDGHGIVDGSDDIFELRKYDIDRMFDETVKHVGGDKK